MRDWQETLEWYDQNQKADQIGFNPDGMCLKVCRTARDIDSMYSSAKLAQDATPAKHRVHEVRDLRKGMVLYFDTVGDSNPYGHIVTMVGRVKGFKDWNDLNDVLVETNSVKSGELVVVRASYFKEHWGDEFQFGATWLNGVVLDTFTKQSRIQRFRRSGPDYNVRLLDQALRLDNRFDIKRYRDTIDDLVDSLSPDKRRTRIAKFKAYYAKNRTLRMRYLDQIVADSPHDAETRRIRNQLRTIIKSLPEK